MIIKQIMEVFDILDGADASGTKIKEYLASKGVGDVVVQRCGKSGSSTDFIKIVIPGRDGKICGGTAPSLGIIGRLGGIGARPECTGFVSDGDGALVVLSVAAKVLEMKSRGDHLCGDVYICTHVCPNAPAIPHTPVPFMGSPVDMAVMNEMEVCAEMDAILSVDTTRGNRLINNNGCALSPTVKEGYILPVSNDLLDIMQITSGKLPCTFPITIQDITPYGNGLYHLNSILQPSIATKAPVVGVAITSETIVPGCATGATNMVSVDTAARFVMETAKAFGEGRCHFFDEEEFALIQSEYGPLKHLQGPRETHVKIGALTIGQSPREEMILEMREFLAGAEILQSGALDKLSREEILRLAPSGDEDVLISRLRDGSWAVLSENRLLPLLQEEIHALCDRGVSAILLLCTGRFSEDFQSSVPIVYPQRLLSSVVPELSNGKKVGILCPEEAQVEQSRIHWEKINRDLAVTFVNPYDPNSDIEQAAKALLDNGAEMVVMDCMGFTESMKRRVAAVTGLPVILPRTLAARVVGAML